MIKINELISYSGDSEFIDYNFKNGKLILSIDFKDLNRIVNIVIRTDKMAINIPKTDDIVFRTCFVELKHVSDFLNTENGIFVPSSSFGKMMQEVKLNLNLAYGLKKLNSQYILSLVGNTRLVSCIVNNIDDIEHDYIDNQLN